MVAECARWSRLELPAFPLTAIRTHPVVPTSQTLLHYSRGHHQLGGVFFRKHIRFRHAYYARGHLVSATYCGDVRQLHAGSNYAAIDFFWNGLLGTYRSPDGDVRRSIYPTFYRRLHRPMCDVSDGMHQIMPIDFHAARSRPRLNELPLARQRSGT